MAAICDEPAHTHFFDWAGSWPAVAERIRSETELARIGSKNMIDLSAIKGTKKKAIEDQFCVDFY